MIFKVSLNLVLIVELSLHQLHNKLYPCVTIICFEFSSAYAETETDSNVGLILCIIGSVLLVVGGIIAVLCYIFRKKICEGTIQIVVKYQVMCEHL
jgi:hypothetical protein